MRHDRLPSFPPSLPPSLPVLAPRHRSSLIKSAISNEGRSWSRKETASVWNRGFYEFSASRWSVSSVPFSLLPFGRECGNTVVETQWLNRDQAVRPSTIFKYLPSPRFVRSNYSSNRAPFSDNNYIGAIVVVFSEFFYIVSASKLFTFENVCNDISWIFKIWSKSVPIIPAIAHPSRIIIISAR